MNITSDDNVQYGISNYCRIIYARRKNGALPAKEFLLSLDIGTRVKFARLLDWLLEQGKITNVQKLKKLQGKSELWEFRVLPYRLFAFQDGNTWVLANGFEKKADKTPQVEINRGVEIRKEYFERKRKIGKLQ